MEDHERYLIFELRKLHFIMVEAPIFVSHSNSDI